MYGQTVVDAPVQGKPRTAAAHDLLTDDELRVAELAGCGMTNTEIGALLDLRPRTVEVYLYRILPLLGVTTRGELADVLRVPRAQ
ncbi:helix-turn-helix transcriptional regulator [Streptomyces sp. V4-01]|uniref:Helix-turn-helix transcriptional regulator n=1 Tax=Actinacidiphila polyblastidii TaxID=3110430 RepID=A0ABU7PMA9_9ACTN|nr:helix-turn-helix transcriptional regulator [Streptomyces sp. V4-01]